MHVGCHVGPAPELRLLLLFRSVECCIARLGQQIEGNQTVALGGDTSPLTASTFWDSEFNQLALPSARFSIAPAFQSLRQPGCPVNVELYRAGGSTNGCIGKID